MHARALPPPEIETLPNEPKPKRVQVRRKASDVPKGSVGAALTPRVADVARKQAAYLKGVLRDGTMTSGCRAAHVDSRTVYAWREDPAFAEEERRIREAMIDGLEAEAIRRGTRGVQQPVYQGGKLVGYRTEYSDALLVLVLKAMRPDRYRERVDISVPQVIKAIGGVDPTDVL